MNSRIGNLLRELSYSMRRNPSLFIGTLLTIFVSLLALGGGLVVGRAVDSATQRWRDGVEFIVFLNPDATAEELGAVQAALEAHPEIDRYTFVNKEEAYSEFSSIFTDSEQVRDSVTVEDMPPSFRIVPLNPDSAVVEELADGFRDDPGVFQVVAAVETIKEIESLTDKINRVFWMIGIALLLSALLLVYNTIRTTIFARRREVEVMRLVGASNWYIRTPFMIEGVLQGLIGGALTIFGLRAWNNFLASIAGEGFALLTDLRAPDQSLLAIWAAMTALGALIGAIASAVALSRFLDV